MGLIIAAGSENDIYNLQDSMQATTAYDSTKSTLIDISEKDYQSMMYRQLSTTPNNIKNRRDREAVWHIVWEDLSAILKSEITS
jgi:hypothetical protein